MDDPDEPAKETNAAGPREERARRRARPQRVYDTSVPSPCIAVCQVDPATDLCIGCRRHIDEIREWPIMTAEQKRAVLAALPSRR